MNFSFACDVKYPPRKESDLFACVDVACTFVDSTLLQHVQSAISRQEYAFLDMRAAHFEHLSM